MLLVVVVVVVVVAIVVFVEVETVEQIVIAKIKNKYSIV